MGECVCTIRRRYGYDDPADPYPTWQFESDHWRPAGLALDGRNRPEADAPVWRRIFVAE